MSDHSIGPQIPVVGSVNAESNETNENDAELMAEYQRTLLALDKQEEEKQILEEIDEDLSDEEDSESDEDMEEESLGNDALDEFSLEDVLYYLKKVKEDPKNDPSEVVTLYEQALKINSKQEELWIEYTDYLQKDLKDYQRAIQVFARALKACPGYIALVQNALLAHEKAGTSVEGIQKIFEDNEEHVQTPEEGTALYTTFIYLVKRLGGSDSDLDLLFKMGCDNLEQYFEKDWDFDTTFRRNYAYFLYSKYKKPEDALEIWRDILKSGYANQAEPWIELIRMERHFGSVEQTRKLLYEAVNSVTDTPNDVFAYFVQFEREEGTRDHVDKALEKINKRFHQLQKQESQRGAKNQNQKVKPQQKGGKKENKSPHKPQHKGKNNVNATENVPPKRKLSEDKKDEVPAKKKSEEKPVVDKDGFAVPSIPVRPKSASSSPKPEKRSSPPPPQPEKEEPMETEPSPSTTQLGNADLTIFLSNFDFSWTENEVRNCFPEAKEIRIPMKTKFTSKGYAYVDFETKEDVQKYLAKDGKLLSKNRPIHISAYQPHAKGEKATFKFGTEKEENKLFVRNVHFDATDDDLQKIFEPYGNLKSVRIVTRPSGQPKGFAYVEFEKAEDAKKAQTETDGHKLKGRKIKVLISDPSAAPKKSDDKPTQSRNQNQQASGTGSDRNSEPKPANLGTTQPRSALSFVPRSRILAAVSKKAPGK